MFDKARRSLREQLVAARLIGWDGELQIVIDGLDAEELLNLMEKADAVSAANTDLLCRVSGVLDPLGSGDRQS